MITDYDFPDLALEMSVFEEAGIDVSTAQVDSVEGILRACEGLDPDALLVQYAPVTKRVFEALENLDVVGVYGIGTDNIDVTAASEHGVPVVNVPTYCQDEVAEHALGLLIACTRRIHLFDESVKAGEWDWEIASPIHRISGSTLGVVGCGTIGARFIELTRGFDFEVLGFDPNLSSAELAELGVEPVDFATLVSRSDFISVHVPLTPETDGMFDKAVFQRMRSNAVIVNTSRGPVVDTGALHQALVNGQIRGAGLDVLPTEPPPKDSPLFARDDVVLTPHTAWYSEESIDVLRETVATDITRVLTGNPPENLVEVDASG